MLTKCSKMRKPSRRFFLNVFLFFMTVTSFWSALQMSLKKNILEGYLKLDRKHPEQAKQGNRIYFGQNFEILYADFESGFKVYTYKVNALAPSLMEIYEAIELIEKMNASLPLNWRVTKNRSTLPPLNSEKQYALEFWLSKWIRKSRFHTSDPDSATAFFINTPCTALKNTQRKRVPSQRVTQLYIKKLVENIMINMPRFTERMNFLDHFYVCSHDMGVESTRSTPLNFRTNAIGVVHTADFLGVDSARTTWNTLTDILPVGQGGLIFNAHRDLTAPPYLLSGAKIFERKTFQTCEFLAMFLGSTTGRSVRGQIFALFSNHSDFLLGLAHGSEYERAFQRSKFCLVVRGLVTSTLRFTEVFIHSCIPVIISDGYIPPFSGTIDWRTFSILVPEKQVSQLPKILDSVSEEKWNYLNDNLVQARKHFLYNNPPVRGDAFHMILYEIWKKVRGWN